MQKTQTQPPIVLMTDFGEQDTFVGVMKGVIATIAPGVPIIDLTHQIPPGDLKRAALFLWQAVQYFPAGTVFVTVVDPGVGSQRRTIAATNDAQFFIAPDNGILSLLQPSLTRCYTLSNPDYALPAPSHTFHGRDIFAPAGAHLANGLTLESFGVAVALETLLQIDIPQARILSSHKISGQVLHADRFGNLITNIQARSAPHGELTMWGLQANSASAIRLSARCEIHWEKETLRFYSTFSDLEVGACGALIGSSGLVEIVMNRGSAEQHFNKLLEIPFTLSEHSGE